MSLKIHKHFDYLTPFSEATNEEELAKIMSLKYPRACSGLETGAEFFARMVQDVRKYEAWRVIGFDSFEEFCAAELGKTLAEVEEIVEGVRILGGNPSEQEAKQASRAQRAREMKAEYPEMTQREIAEKVGLAQPNVHKALKVDTLKPVTPKKGIKTPVVRLAQDPTATARNIVAKMGRDYAERLCVALKEGSL